MVMFTDAALMFPDGLISGDTGGHHEHAVPASLDCVRVQYARSGGDHHTPECLRLFRAWADSRPMHGGSCLLPEDKDMNIPAAFDL
jgi:hypothetical protein